MRASAASVVGAPPTHDDGVGNRTQEVSMPPGGATCRRRASNPASYAACPRARPEERRRRWRSLFCFPAEIGRGLMYADQMLAVRVHQRPFSAGKRGPMPMPSGGSGRRRRSARRSRPPLPSRLMLASAARVSWHRHAGFERMRQDDLACLRHYDPTLGRYTQPDPLGFVDGLLFYRCRKLPVFPARQCHA